MHICDFLYRYVLCHMGLAEFHKDWSVFELVNHCIFKRTHNCHHENCGARDRNRLIYWYCKVIRHAWCCNLNKMCLWQMPRRKSSFDAKICTQVKSLNLTHVCRLVSCALKLVTYMQESKKLVCKSSYTQVSMFKWLMCASYTRYLFLITTRASVSTSTLTLHV